MQSRPEGMRQLVEELFRPSAAAQPDGSMGAELELIPVRSDTHRRVPINTTAGGRGSAAIMREAAGAHDWRETTDAYGAPSWITRDEGRISYEPGGQIEIISPVFRSHVNLGQFLRNTLGSLREPAAAEGVSLLAVGVDPYNDIEAVPLQLHAPRYDAMTGYFDSIGQSGVRMMRQTASLHVSVELGPRVMERWSLLNALAPYLTASFANSEMYAGHSTGYASYRARLWQTLDPTRTGLPFDPVDPVGAYVRFAIGAGRILDDDRAHLTTLFPEIRPRGYFEIRSMDSMEPDRVDAALRFISSLVHDADIAAAAMRIIGHPDPALLQRAAESGRADAVINERLNMLERLAVEPSASAHGA